MNAIDLVPMRGATTTVTPVFLHVKGRQNSSAVEEAQHAF